MRKIFLFFLLLLVMAGALFFLTKDLIAQIAFQKIIYALTGLHSSVREARFDLLKGSVSAEDAILFNPDEFEKSVFMHVSEFYIRLDLPALLKKESVHIQELKLDVRELNAETNKKGLSNVSFLTSFKKKKAGADSGPPGRKMPFRLNRFELKLNRVTYHDRSSLLPKKLSVNVTPENHVYEGINQANAIGNIIVMRVIEETPFGTFGINPIEVNNQLKKSVRTFRSIGAKMLVEPGKKILVDPGVQLAQKSQEVGQLIYAGGMEKVSGVSTATKQEIEDVFGKLRTKIMNTDWKTGKESEKS